MARKPPPLPKTAEFKRATTAAFEEIEQQEPKSVIASGKTGEAKRKMEIAIALSKARATIKR